MQQYAALRAHENRVHQQWRWLHRSDARRTVHLFFHLVHQRLRYHGRVQLRLEHKGTRSDDGVVGAVRIWQDAALDDPLQAVDALEELRVDRPSGLVSDICGHKRR